MTTSLSCFESFKEIQSESINVHFGSGLGEMIEKDIEEDMYAHTPAAGWRVESCLDSEYAGSDNSASYMSGESQDSVMRTREGECVWTIWDSSPSLFLKLHALV